MMTGLAHIACGILSLALASQLTDAAVANSADPVALASSFARHNAQCAGKEGWSDPAPPVHIFGNVFDVGTCGITVLLIAGDRGAVVIDGATAKAVPSIIGNIEQLGFKLSDVKLLLSTHEHSDHAAGLYELRRRTGAKMVATAASRAALESGVPAAEDPQRDGDKAEFRGVKIDRVVRDGEVVVLGSLRLTAHATPGHAPGSTSWSWRSCEGSVCHQIVYADSVSAVSTEKYRFSEHPDYVRAFRSGIQKIGALPCDLIVTPHPGASNLYERLAGHAPLSSGTACISYANVGRVKLDQHLARERKNEKELR